MSSRRSLGSLLRLGRASRLRDYAIVGAFVVLFIALSIASDSFLTRDNLVNIVNQWVPVAVIGLGLMVVLMTGGFDLSIGSVFALAGVVAATVANQSTGPLGLAAGVLVGLVAGIANGVITTLGRVNAFVATLGVGVVCAGLAIVVTGGGQVRASGEDFTGLGMGTALTLPIAIYIFVGIVLCVWFALNRMSYGRYLRAVGGNPAAARLSGLSVGAIQASVFVIIGGLVGFAASLVASRSATASAYGSPTLAIDVYTAVLLGGNTFGGGVGGVWRTLVGVGILALLRNGFNLLGIDPLYQQVASGVILLAAVLIAGRMRSAAA